jgi:S1-C subfamily serine protease
MPPQALRWSAGGPSFQLAKLDDDLAYYFKTREGVLVVKAPKDGKLGLKGGDVIQKIGDRRTGDPREVLDAISERAPGEKLKLEVMRQGKLTQLDGVMPEN